MCGIAAISLAPSDTVMDVRQVAASLLLGIESRGRDATGASWYDAQKRTVELTKLPVPARRFIPAREEVLPHSTPTMILHTRWGTHGSAQDRANNHPIKYGNIVGVHNGVLSNHHEVFAKINRKPFAQVDSEAIFAMLDAVDEPLQGFQLLRGDAAVAWIDMRQPDALHVARVNDRPVHVVQTAQGSLIMASTAHAVDGALEDNGLRVDWRADLEDETYIKVVGGVITDWARIPGIVKDRGWSSQFAYTSGTTVRHTDRGRKTTVKKYKPTPRSPQKALTGRSDDTLLFSDAETAEKWSTWTNEWHSRLSTEQLVKLAANGSQTAVRHLAERGRDEKGRVYEPVERVG